MCKGTILRRFILSLAIFALMSASNALAQAPAGSVTSLTGDVHIERAGTTVPATLGMALSVGDRVVTASNSRVTITLTDNSKLELDQSTSLVIDQQLVGANSRSTKLSLFSGLVRSLVSHTSGTTNFQVNTPNAVASARGTGFDTETDDKERKEYKDCRRFTQVSVYEGTVEVTNSTNPSAGSKKVPAGYKTLVACGLAPLSATPIAAAAATTTTAAAATTAITSTTALAVAGGVVVAGAVAGGVAAGSSGGGGGGNKPVISPKH